MGKTFETVIGLEVHVQLATNTKLFCGCSTTFGADENTHVCPVCLGLPGVLPVLNRKAFEYSLKVALALDCKVQEKIKFDRKNYYYPDLPKAYQISQFDMPIGYSGKIAIELESGEEKEIGITRAHLEEDAGKLIHDARQPFSYVDLNRTGTPLLEIVSEPDLRTPEEAYRYLTLLKAVVKSLNVSDCNMEEGSLRCDANISLREEGEEKLGSKVEIKNLNSFKAVRDALLYEQKRQAEVLTSGGTIPQETRLWDADNNVTLSMRSKENTQDYRYFPDPDLVPFEVNQAVIDKIKKEMPELPKEKEKRFCSEYGLDEKDAWDFATVLNSSSEYYECVIKKIKEDNKFSDKTPQVVCNWIKGEILRYINEKKVESINDFNIEVSDFSDLINMVEEDCISGLKAKKVLGEMIETGKKAKDIVTEQGLEQVSDEGALAEAVEKVIQNNEKSVSDYKNGKTNALGFLVGQVMKETKGKANPKMVNEMLRKML